MALIIVLCTLSFGVGILVGARAYYLYADHIYMKYPENFRKILEYKIQKKKEKGGK